MGNIVTDRAKEFLENVNNEELKKLVFCNNLEWFPEDHIMRKFVDYVYQDNNVGFTLGMASLYPYIAQETYRRFVNVALKPYQQN